MPRALAASSTSPATGLPSTVSVKWSATAPGGSGSSHHASCGCGERLRSVCTSSVLAAPSTIVVWICSRPVSTSRGIGPGRRSTGPGTNRHWHGARAAVAAAKTAAAAARWIGWCIVLVPAEGRANGARRAPVPAAVCLLSAGDAAHRAAEERHQFAQPVVVLVPQAEPRVAEPPLVERLGRRPGRRHLELVDPRPALLPRGVEAVVLDHAAVAVGPDLH